MDKKKKFFDYVGAECRGLFDGLCAYAESNGLKVCLRVGDCLGDFQICVYDERVSPHCLVFFDGDIVPSVRLSLERCVRQTEIWIGEHLSLRVNG